MRDRGARSCEVVSTTFRDDAAGHSSPEAALGDLLDEAARVEEDADDSKGFETVTFSGYDADGTLLERVVVEGGRTWRVARIDACS